eukprot:4811663-Prymnesium_polylepis.2
MSNSASTVARRVKSGSNMSLRARLMTCVTWAQRQAGCSRAGLQSYGRWRWQPQLLRAVCGGSWCARVPRREAFQVACRALVHRVPL